MENECVAVVGESGSGKTTFARCLTGLHGSWEGQLTFGETDLTPGVRHRSTETLRQMQYIFQNPYASLNPRRTIGSSIAQPLEHFGIGDRSAREARVADAIERVSLSLDLINRYPDELSGGERQRVAIARALVVSPKLLVCDEITSALDVSVQAAVVETLLTLQAQQSLSMVFITHNLALVRSIAQRVVVLSRGNIVESGPTESVLDDPQHEYTRRLLADAPHYQHEQSAQAASEKLTDPV
jgi:peptide/nickel transport system ATP-binding protein